MYFLAKSCMHLRLKKLTSSVKNFLLIRDYVFGTRSLNSRTTTPRRAVLYVPGHDLRKIKKIQSINVDCVVLDCEDGVAVNKKEDARQIICQISDNFDFGNREYAIRINSIDSELAEKDLSSILNCQRLPDTIMVPKVETLDHIRWLKAQFSFLVKPKDVMQKINLLIYIESAVALLDAREICKETIELSQDAHFALAGLVFGSDDYCADIGATRTSGAQEVLMARQHIVAVAKSFRVQAVDIVYIDYKDLEGLRTQAIEGARMGFTGKQVIHPDQIAVVQNAFSPSTEKIAWARELICLFNDHQKHGKGAFVYRGAMIDKPLLLQARNVIDVAEKLETDQKINYS